MEHGLNSGEMGVLCSVTGNAAAKVLCGQKLFFSLRICLKAQLPLSKVSRY